MKASSSEPTSIITAGRGRGRSILHETLPDHSFLKNSFSTSSGHQPSTSEKTISVSDRLSLLLNTASSGKMATTSMDSNNRGSLELMGADARPVLRRSMSTQGQEDKFTNDVHSSSSGDGMYSFSSKDRYLILNTHKELLN